MISSRRVRIRGALRLGTAIALVASIASPGKPDDRQLLQTGSASAANVLVILDSSSSMARDFTDHFDLPGSLDDFVYPQGTAANTNGSKLGVAKSALRQVLTNFAGVNWAFACYRNPGAAFGAAAIGKLGEPVGGARLRAEALENGGLEWLYFADAVDGTSPNSPGAPISSVFDPADYPDIQQGRFLTLGHRVMHNYNREDTFESADVWDPYARVGVPVSPPIPGFWRGAFGPNPSYGSPGATSGLVTYRNPAKPGFELRMRVVSGNYGDPDVVIAVEEFKAPQALPSGTPAISATPTATTAPALTPTHTATLTATPSPSPTESPVATPASTATVTRTPTPSRTPSATRTPSSTRTPSRTKSATPTRTPTAAGIATPTPTPFASGPTLPFRFGLFHRAVLSSALLRRLSPSIRALWPPTPSPLPAVPTRSPCPGIPPGVLPDTLYCGRCSDSIPWEGGRVYAAGELVVPTAFDGFAFRAANAGSSGVMEPRWTPVVGAEVADNGIRWKAEPERLCGFVDLDGDGDPDPFPLPRFDRGFDDPQADPDATFQASGKRIFIRYRRADLYSLKNPFPGNPIFPYQAKARDADNGNPPWGSQPGSGDMDSDGSPDQTVLADRVNRGAFASGRASDRSADARQAPNDAVAGPSGPWPGNVTCDLYRGDDCGGLALFDSRRPEGVGGAPYSPYPVGAPPPAESTWPIVPFPRDWLPYKAADSNSVTAIKRLLRFASSLVSFDPTQAHMLEYRLAEDATNVVVTSPVRPLAGALKDARDYFKDSVFLEKDDPAIDCRNFIIVLIVDGADSAGADPCSGGPTGKGPAGDLGVLPLPESSPGARALASAADPGIRTIGVPVYVISLGRQAAESGGLRCIAENSGGAFFEVNDRLGVLQAFESIRPLQAARLFTAPALPAFVNGNGDAGLVAGVVPSHQGPGAGESPGSAASWAIWSGSLKAFALDSNGKIPTVAGGVRASPTPVARTIEPGFPDESNPDDPNPRTRRPVWNASRVLGYTDPVGTLAGGKDAVKTAATVEGAPAILVWPGRKMLWASGKGQVPLARQDFSIPAGTCGGVCFDSLTKAMGLDPSIPADVTRATQTVQFLRGGKTPWTGSRDEVLTDLGTYGAVSPGTKYSFVYQDDAPAGNDPSVASTDGSANPRGYAHKLGDIFHSEPLVLMPPRDFRFLSADVTPRTGSCGMLPDCSYARFSALHSKRRKVAFAGSNDGFLHAFDAGVAGRDPDVFGGDFDLGTGREIFAYVPRPLIAGFPGLLGFPPEPSYFVDGPPALADVFIGPTLPDGAPDPGNRTWKTVLIGGLRQGGRHYFALDVTQPDVVNPDGTKKAPRDSSPDCLDGGPECAAPYPTILWEITDDCGEDPASCIANPPVMGETWSRPAVGRIRVVNGGSPEDRYVAIFGGGFDAGFSPGREVLADDQKTRGRALYIVNVETGKILYKATAGRDGKGNEVRFAPMPAPPAAADIDDDGYLDVVYIGDLNGRMWKVDLTPDPAAGRGVCGVCGSSAETLGGYRPFLLYDALASAVEPVQPVFLEAAVISLFGGSPPSTGIAFGTGYRAELLQPNRRSDPRDPTRMIPYVNRFHFVIDSGAGETLRDTDLVNLTPAGGDTPPGTGAASTPNGYFLDYGSYDEKAVSTVLSTRGTLTLVTFAPSSGDPCATGGNSYSYSFFFADGRGGYATFPAPPGTPGALEDYRRLLGRGPAQAAQSQSADGEMIDTVLFSGGAVGQKSDPSTINSRRRNWKEQ